MQILGALWRRIEVSNFVHISIRPTAESLQYFNCDYSDYCKIEEKNKLNINHV